MAKTNRRKPPSRVRYEQAHPTISCRVPRDVYNKLRTVKKLGSFADILKAGMGVIETREKEREEFMKLRYVQGYEDGYAEAEDLYDDGYTDAEDLYKAEYPCSVCGKIISITTDSAKKAASEYMQEHRWGHGECQVNEQQNG